MPLATPQNVSEISAQRVVPVVPTGAAERQEVVVPGMPYREADLFVHALSLLLVAALHQLGQPVVPVKTAGPACAGPAGVSTNFPYDSHVQSQPSAQLSQQPLSQLQSGQPSQQLLLQQLPAHVVAAGVVAANANALVASAPMAARDQRDFVNMIYLTFWLMKLIDRN